MEILFIVLGVIAMAILVIVTLHTRAEKKEVMNYPTPFGIDVISDTKLDDEFLWQVSETARLAKVWAEENGFKKRIDVENYILIISTESKVLDHVTPVITITRDYDRVKEDLRRSILEVLGYHYAS